MMLTCTKHIDMINAIPVDQPGFINLLYIFNDLKKMGLKTSSYFSLWSSWFIPERSDYRISILTIVFVGTVRVYFSVWKPNKTKHIHRKFFFTVITMQFIDFESIHRISRRYLRNNITGAIEPRGKYRRRIVVSLHL